tara:strand:+ start:19902 stop:20198 length:297 start_codon:yes stop_codon:yes gene_type:complete
MIKTLLRVNLYIYIKNNITIIYMKGCTAPYSSPNFNARANYPGSYVAYNKMEYTGGRKKRRMTKKRGMSRRRRSGRRKCRCRRISRRRRRKSKSQRGG